MAETFEGLDRLYVLACVCTLELETLKSEYSVLLVPTNFPKKKRSLRRPKRLEKPRSSSSPDESDCGVAGSNLKISGTILGKKRCFFEVDDPKNKKQRKRANGQVGLNGTQLPRNFLDHIKALAGSDVKLVIEKKLTKTDLDNGNHRISMPLSKIQSEFLTEDEEESLTIKNGKHLMGIDVFLWDPFLDQSTKLCLKKWDYKNNSSSYMLIENWNYVAIKNQLRADMMVQMWSFRVNSRLCFALVY